MSGIEEIENFNANIVLERKKIEVFLKESLIDQQRAEQIQAEIDHIQQIMSIYQNMEQIKKDNLQAILEEKKEQLKVLLKPNHFDQKAMIHAQKYNDKLNKNIQQKQEKIEKAQFILQQQRDIYKEQKDKELEKENEFRREMNKLQCQKNLEYLKKPYQKLLQEDLSIRKISLYRYNANNDVLVNSELFHNFNMVKFQKIVQDEYVIKSQLNSIGPDVPIKSVDFYQENLLIYAVENALQLFEYTNQYSEINSIQLPTFKSQINYIKILKELNLLLVCEQNQNTLSIYDLSNNQYVLINTLKLDSQVKVIEQVPNYYKNYNQSLILGLNNGQIFILQDYVQSDSKLSILVSEKDDIRQQQQYKEFSQNAISAIQFPKNSKEIQKQQQQICAVYSAQKNLLKIWDFKNQNFVSSSQQQSLQKKPSSDQIDQNEKSENIEQDENMVEFIIEDQLILTGGQNGEIRVWAWVNNNLKNSEDHHDSQQQTQQENHLIYWNQQQSCHSFAIIFIRQEEEKQIQKNQSKQKHILSADQHGMLLRWDIQHFESELKSFLREFEKVNIQNQQIDAQIQQQMQN